jgi:hypothetical protein
VTHPSQPPRARDPKPISRSPQRGKHVPPKPLDAAERERVQTNFAGVPTILPAPTLEAPCLVSPDAAAEAAQRFLRGEGLPRSFAIPELRAEVVPVVRFDTSYRIRYRGERARSTSTARTIGRDTRGNDVSLREPDRAWSPVGGKLGFARTHLRVASARSLPVVVERALLNLPSDALRPLDPSRAERNDDPAWIANLDGLKADLARNVLAEARSEARLDIAGDGQRLHELSCAVCVRGAVAALATVYLGTFEFEGTRHTIAIDGTAGGVACTWTDTPRAGAEERRLNFLSGVVSCFVVSGVLLFECNPTGARDTATIALGPLGVFLAGYLLFRLVK